MVNFLRHRRSIFCPETTRILVKQKDQRKEYTSDMPAQVGKTFLTVFITIKMF